MRLRHLAVRHFRNLADTDLTWPAEGVLLLGANGQGKTNLLEAAYYPVLQRSLRGAPDAELVQFGAAGFHVRLVAETADGVRDLAAGYLVEGRRKQVRLDGAPQERLTDVVGTWLAVAFLPEDVELAAGPATLRRQFLDRVLSLADRGYLAALLRYRAALRQRNAALRQGKADLARAFDAPLAAAGAVVMRARCAWVAGAGARFGEELAALGVPGEASLAYEGKAALADAEAWPALLEAAAGRDALRRTSTLGPHRDDLELRLAGRAVRTFGSTGQQRAAAVALKLLELETLAAARGERPCLLLDDVFAELDGERQRRLAARVLAGGGQVLITAPRADEAPPGVALPVWEVRGGSVHAGGQDR